jgi:hypothetical protein
VIDVPDTRYARALDGVYIAYQVVGDGPVDIVWQFDWVGNVDLIWQHPIDFGRAVAGPRTGVPNDVFRGDRQSVRA